MFRCARRIIICLLHGAIVNVAVAWGCATIWIDIAFVSEGLIEPQSDPNLVSDIVGTWKRTPIESRYAADSSISISTWMSIDGPIAARQMSVSVIDGPADEALEAKWREELMGYPTTTVPPDRLLWRLVWMADKITSR